MPIADRLFADEINTPIDRLNSFIITYPSLLQFFQRRDAISSSDFVIATHMVYGWMPTMLELYTNNPDGDLEWASHLLTSVKTGNDVTNAELERLIKLVNNSLVGVSKLLHFAKPDKFSIWDSRVYRYFYQEKPHFNRVRDISKYRSFLDTFPEIINNEGFRRFFNSVINKMGYEVTPIRAIEVIMFLNGAREE